MPADILAITTNPEFGHMLTLALPLFGFQSRVVEPEESIPLAERQPPDAVLIDLPWNTSAHFMLCERLRRVPALADVPIVFVTTDTRPARWDDVLLHGGDDLILLPVHFTSLADRLRFHLAQAARRACRPLPHSPLRGAFSPAQRAQIL